MKSITLSGPAYVKDGQRQRLRRPSEGAIIVTNEEAERLEKLDLVEEAEDAPAEKPARTKGGKAAPPKAENAGD